MHLLHADRLLLKSPFEKSTFVRMSLLQAVQGRPDRHLREIDGRRGPGPPSLRVRRRPGVQGERQEAGEGDGQVQRRAGREGRREEGELRPRREVQASHSADRHQVQVDAGHRYLRIR